MVYPEAAERLKSAINTELQTRGMEGDAKILSEVLYMEDASWQECAEAALGFRRFDIIVSPAHYQAAKLQVGLDERTFSHAPDSDRGIGILEIRGGAACSEVTPFADHGVAEESVMCFV